MSWSSSHRSTEYRLIMTLVIGLCAASAAGSVVPGLDTAIGAVLIGAVVVAVGVAVVRRELRIRRRLADLDGTIRPAPRPSDPTPALRPGPADAARPRLTVVGDRCFPATPLATPVPSPAGGHRSLGHIHRRCRMTSPAHPDRPTPPSVREIAALTARLRELSARGRDVDEADRAAFLADKDALLARIPHAAPDGRAPHIHAAIVDRPEPPATVDHVVDLDRPWTTQGTTRDTAHAVATDQDLAVSMPWVTVAEADQQEQRRDQLARWHTDDQTDHQDDSDSDAASPETDAGRQVWVCDDAPGLP